MPRLNAEARCRVIINAAIKVSLQKQSVYNWTRQELAEACETQTSIETIKHYYPSINDLRKEVAGLLNKR